MFEMYDHLVSNLLKYYPGKALPIEAGFNKSSIFIEWYITSRFQIVIDVKTILMGHVFIQTKFFKLFT